MEQLIALGSDNPNPQTVEEEYVYEPAAGVKRKTKVPTPPQRRFDL